ncbi:MAG: hypothetical protein ABIH18_00360 [Candidatus Omnitrophota bacterium]
MTTEPVAKCLKFVILRLDRRIYKWFIDDNRSCAFAQDDSNGVLQQPPTVINAKITVKIKKPALTLLVNPV